MNQQAESPFSLEDAIRRIKDIQGLLQEGQLNFDQALALYEEAEKLIKQSQEYLNHTELRIKHLTDNE